MQAYIVCRCVKCTGQWFVGQLRALGRLIGQRNDAFRFIALWPISVLTSAVPAVPEAEPGCRLLQPSPEPQSSHNHVTSGRRVPTGADSCRPSQRNVLCLCWDFKTPSFRDDGRLIFWIHFIWVFCVSCVFFFTIFFKSS